MEIKRKERFELINSYTSSLTKHSTGVQDNSRRSNLKDRIELIISELMSLNLSGTQSTSATNLQIILNTIKSIKQDQLPLLIINQLINKLKFQLLKLKLNYSIKIKLIREDYLNEIEEFGGIKSSENNEKFINLKEYLKFIKTELNSKFNQYTLLTTQLKALRLKLDNKLIDYKKQLMVKESKMEVIRQLIDIKLENNLNQIDLESEINLIKLNKERSEFDINFELREIKQSKEELITKENLITSILSKTKDSLNYIQHELKQINNLKTNQITINLQNLKLNYKKIENLIVNEFKLVNLTNCITSDSSSIKDNNTSIELVKFELDKIIELNYKKFLIEKQLDSVNLMKNEIEINYNNGLQNSVVN
ncbi:hypothetical protein CONCODRAFT_8873 [Conidiobolus coronatus NRRL 28638]|uniref:Uncharacterized protein n=1 Tax=Conidiobolus coronatus (strain ATCC 28846 / CBS 209.66 / NRRL 28638) TaxID=796925 RepID=A0A137P188_CONC2|nr:hypothetical protein CONCODRAFT_8873 [Conidiobolus coronatus NRRL 28638]|eukprot:KXN68813.1 hypothetical protein CONCODRAFT_8873 [Conidiobolus coronatus NRRL 28638]